MTLQKYANIDMNDFVSIKPTEAGWRQILADVDRSNDNLRRNPRCMHRISVPKADADGYISGQFWSLMKSFDWENCDPGGDMPFSDLRFELPNMQQETVANDKSTRPKEFYDFMDLAKIPTQFLSNSGKIKKVNSAKWAVEEIRRLRARVNWLIKTINDADTYGNHMHSGQDLIEEEEI